MDLSWFYGTEAWWLALFAFLAGFMDAVVGGGGLIQLPALLIQLPQQPLPMLMGTNKLAGIAGTTTAAWQYGKRIKFNYRLLAWVSATAFVSAYAGAKLLHLFDEAFLRQLMLVLLVGMALYTWFKKDLGMVAREFLPGKRSTLYGVLLGGLVGFYDGFFGPGTGSLLVLGFVALLGFEFVQASAYAKLVNVVTNIAALLVFLGQGNYLPELALLMALCHIGGSFLGTRQALLRGNGFVRRVFLLVMLVMIVRYGLMIM
ncbi:MAG: sulfite exporter TauE/SafE family protein [Bacteroidia bacterium]